MISRFAQISVTHCRNSTHVGVEPILSAFEGFPRPHSRAVRGNVCNRRMAVHGRESCRSRASGPEPARTLRRQPDAALKGPLFHMAISRNTKGPTTWQGGGQLLASIHAVGERPLRRGWNLERHGAVRWNRNRRVDSRYLGIRHRQMKFT
jgi:hypothetical protein